MSSNKHNASKRKNTTDPHTTSSEETIKIPGLTNDQKSQMKPQIFTSSEPSKPDKIPDYMDESQLDQDSIRTIVNEIQKTPKNKEKRVEYFTIKYPDFADKYPILFVMACREDFDFEKFNYMMRIRGQIATKQRTIEHASVEVGQKFFNMYMKKD